MTRAVHVEEGDNVAHLERLAIHVGHREWQFADPADRYVAGDDREGDARQPAVMDVDVRPTDFRVENVEHRRAGLETRPGNLLQPDALAGAGHDRGGNGSTHARFPRCCQRRMPNAGSSTYSACISCEYYRPRG